MLFFGVHVDLEIGVQYPICFLFIALLIQSFDIYLLLKIFNLLKYYLKLYVIFELKNLLTKFKGPQTSLANQIELL